VLYIDGFVEPVRSTVVTCPPFVDAIVGYLVEDGTFVKEGDLLCTLEAAELQTAYDNAVLELEDSETNLNKTRADLAMQFALLEAEVKNNEAETSIAQLDSLQLEYATPSQKRVKELELQQVDIRRKRYEKKLNALSIIQQTDIKSREMQIQRRTLRLQTAKERLESLEIKAPKDGLAVRAIYRGTGKKLQVGDNVWNSMPIIDFPELSAMKVKIKAPEIDYKYISINDSVVFTFDAMPGNVAWGKITMKSPVGQPMKDGSKVKYFDIEASIDSTLVMPEPGFTTNCRVILKQVKDTIVVPQIAVFEEDSMKVVYVKTGKKFEMRQVSTGLSSPREAIISAGIAESEVIALSKPEPSSVKGKVLLPVEVDSVEVNTKETIKTE
jgi:multidrug efflux pump subunit AcrA (membrane-fusion protein)